MVLRGALEALLWGKGCSFVCIANGGEFRSCGVSHEKGPKQLESSLPSARCIVHVVGYMDGYAVAIPVIDDEGRLPLASCPKYVSM